MLLLTFLLALLLAFWGIPIVKTLALTLNIVDRPSARKVHRQPIARLGGVAIWFATLLALLPNVAIAPLTQMPLLPLLWILLGGLGFFAIGLLDDLFQLPARSRLLAQAGVASLVWGAGIQIQFLDLPFMGIVQLGWLSLPITVLWLTGVVNAINWMDGLDGLASGVSGIAAIVMLIIALFMQQPVAALIMAALLGSLLGFLYYNFNPAQIFMGDGGSYFIGFTIASTSIIGLTKSATAIAVFLPLLILAVPLLDMSAVIVNRVRKGRSPFHADKGHLHHRLLQAGLPHRLTVLWIYALTFWGGSLALALVGIPSGLLMVSSATGLLGCASWKAWRSRRF